MSAARRQFFIVAARDWLGTPFHFGARIQGEGVDCVQLIIAAALSAGLLTDPDLLRDYPRMSERNMLAILRTHFDQVEAPGDPGDVIWLHTRANRPFHFAIITDPGRILHANLNAGSVVETEIPLEYRSRIHSVWKFKALTNE